MKKNEEILNLAEEIMVDITNNRLPLHNICLKTSGLSLLLDLSGNVDLFKQWAKFAEQNQFVVDAFKSNIESAKDGDVSITSANPQQYVMSPLGNVLERSGIRDRAEKIVGFMAHYRAETYNFALGVYTKWKFGNIAENIFDKKRSRTEPMLRAIFPDINQRLNSIEQNIKSGNPEDWKGAVASCRTLIMDIADILNPPASPQDKDKYINRLKDFVSPKAEGKTKKKLIKTFLDELERRIEYTSNFTQGGAHQQRPTLIEAENVVLYTYLLISDLIEIYTEHKQKLIKTETDQTIPLKLPK